MAATLSKRGEYCKEVTAWVHLYDKPRTHLNTDFIFINLIKCTAHFLGTFLTVKKGLYKSLGVVLKLGHLRKWTRSILTVLVCGGGEDGEE